MEVELRLRNARDLFLTSKIEADDYKLMKKDYSLRITSLKRELSSIAKEKHSIESLLVKGVDNLIKLNETYINRNLSDARSLIGLVYPENFTIRENKIQTARVNKFGTISRTIINHYQTILNYFDKRSTNATAESFNAKIKAFRGVRNIEYFLFRLTNIYG